MILAQAFSRFVFDLDGVVWRADEPIAGAPETIRSLRDAGKRVAFVTNNSGETPERYAKKLADMGAGGSPEEVVTSADATAALLERAIPGLRGRLAYVIGGEGLRQAVKAVGVRIAPDDEGADASLVVVGIDRDLSYDKLRVATTAIRNGAIFVASNTDATYPAPAGEQWPGAGAIVAALRTTTGIDPLVAGKPEPTMLEIAAKRLGGTPALAVGDRVETDIMAATAMGWPSALVLSGATGVPELAAAPAWPDFVLRRLTELLEDRPHPTLRPAAGPDLPLIASMLHQGGLIAGAARERIGRTVVAESDRKPIATASWEPFGDKALLRSVAVSDEHRRSGTGTLVVASMLRKILESGIRDVYLVTETAERFFTACGFRTIDRGELPEEIERHPQVARECSITAPTMHLVLPVPQSR
ncbi:MAG TPA: HAD-IIA family hydrolase [Actinomycetota bacterium]|nr:HAD-IIA family hydrolase [Actinomycetota bacterium]